MEVEVEVGVDAIMSLNLFAQVNYKIFDNIFSFNVNPFGKINCCILWHPIDNWPELSWN